MTKENIIDNIARLNSETWRDREEVRMEIGKLLSELKKALEQQPSDDDCVSRKAVDLLCFKYLKPNNDDNIAFYEHFCDLPPVTPAQRWIPCSERLPEEIGTYLVTLEYKEHGKGITTLWYHGKQFGWDLRVADVVVAWQPLPQPYEEKRGGEND